jgi:hypothetical protein
MIMGDSSRRAACRAQTAMIIGVLSLVTACGRPSGSDNVQACATFNHSYQVWQPSAHDEAANQAFVAALDNAATSAGHSELAGALQAVAANVRQLNGHHGATPLLLRAVTLVRKTCPAK